MSLFDKYNNNNEISGLQIMEQSNLLYQLFANNTYLFLRNTLEEFNRARAAIQIYEDILGACLNVGKSVIIPLTHPLPWP